MENTYTIMVHLPEYPESAFQVHAGSELEAEQQLARDLAKDGLDEQTIVDAMEVVSIL